MKHSHRRTAGAVALVVLLTSAMTGPAAAGGDSAAAGVSGPSPFGECPGNTSIYTHNSETEPWVAVNPRNPENIAVTWQQDRFTTGSSRGIMVAVSRDRGTTWDRTPLPGFSPCVAAIGRVTNPYATFGPDGSLYVTATMIGDRTSIWVIKSPDGGTTWQQPIALIDTTRDYGHDKQAVTVDPRDPNRVYVVWNTRDLLVDKHDVLLSTSRDGGRTWDQPRAIYRPETTAGTIGNQILVLPDGALLNVFFESDHPIGGKPSPPLPDKIVAIRSTDRGATWSAPVAVADIELDFPSFPDTGANLMAPGIVPDVALDPVTGVVYAVWAEAGLSTSRSAVGLTASYDGGRSWTAKRRVSLTPDSADGGNGQAFLPQVDVGRNGTVAVTYYDFRNNTPDAGTPVDHWMATCRGLFCPLTGRLWDERHLAGPYTGLEGVSMSFGAPFIGTYVGLASRPGQFVSVFVAPTGDPANPQDVQLVSTPTTPSHP